MMENQRCRLRPLRRRSVTNIMFAFFLVLVQKVQISEISGAFKVENYSPFLGQIKEVIYSYVVRLQLCLVSCWLVSCQLVNSWLVSCWLVKPCLVSCWQDIIFSIHADHTCKSNPVPFQRDVCGWWVDLSDIRYLILVVVVTTTTLTLKVNHNKEFQLQQVNPPVDQVLKIT